MSINGFARFVEMGMDIISDEQRFWSEKPAWHKAFCDAPESPAPNCPIEMHDLARVLCVRGAEFPHSP
jgi:hypothetical protein